MVCITQQFDYILFGEGYATLQKSKLGHFVSKHYFGEDVGVKNWSRTQGPVSPRSWIT